MWMGAKVVDRGSHRNMVGLIKLAMRNAEERASGRRYSPTLQTARTIAALKAIGLERSQFRARTPVDRRTGEYGYCEFHLLDDEAHAIVEAEAEALADCGFVVHVVKLSSGRSHCLGRTSGEELGQVHRRDFRELGT